MAALFLVLTRTRTQILAKMKVGSTGMCPERRTPPGCYEVHIRVRSTKGKKMRHEDDVGEYSDHLALFTHDALA